MAKKTELTIKQKRFADYYIELGNATEAAIRAGYSKRTAKVIASDNLKKPIIKDYIAGIMAQKDAEQIAKQDEVLKFLTDVMRGNVVEKVPLGLGMGEQTLVKKDLDGKDRIKAAELLGKRYAMWTEKKDIDASVAVTIIDDLDDLDE